MRSGGFDITCLTDGAGVFGPDVFPDMTAAQIDALIGGPILTEFNAYLIRRGAELTLVDTGCGTLFGPDCGKLPALLAAMNIAPQDIDRLIFTHLHGDHCGGALLDGSAVFDRAQVILHQNEAAYWQNTDATAAQVLQAYGAQITLVTGDQQIAQGMTTWALPGHTPGHMGLRLGSDLVLVGDIFHAGALQFANPQISTKYDTDPDQARDSRLSAFAEIAAKGLIFAGGHALGPKQFLRLTPNKQGYSSRHSD